MDRLGVCDKDELIRFWSGSGSGSDYENFLSDSSPLIDGVKNNRVLKSMIFEKCIGPDMFSWIRHYVAEVCAPPSALLVFLCSATVSNKN